MVLKPRSLFVKQLNSILVDIAKKKKKKINLDLLFVKQLNSILLDIAKNK